MTTKKFYVELIIGVDVEAINREEAENKALQLINDNSLDYINAESITRPKPEPIYFTRIDKDTNGNPRYVCHFLNFITDKDSRPADYNTALARAKKIGGRKFHNKQYGGGIVFQSYNTDDLQKDIFELLEQYK